MKPANPVVNDLEAAFAALSGQGRSFEIDRRNWSFFSGGHFQGVQYFPGVPPRLAISSSSRHNAYLVICSLEDLDRNPTGEVLNVTALAGLPLKHAGGIQSVGDFFAVGLEDDEGQRDSQILFLQLEDASPIPRLIPHLSIRRSGPERVSTAGAAGLVDDGDGYLLAVGSWDSETIDFYTAPADAFFNTAKSFSLAVVWKESEADRSGWSDPAFRNYQSLNLVRSLNPSQSADSALYLLGFASRGSRDWADLYRLDLDRAPQQMLVKVSARRMETSGGVRFSRGAGVWVESPQRIRIFAVKGSSGGFSSGESIVLNVFE